LLKQLCAVPLRVYKAETGEQKNDNVLTFYSTGWNHVFRNEQIYMNIKSYNMNKDGGTLKQIVRTMLFHTIYRTGFSSSVGGYAKGTASMISIISVNKGVVTPPSLSDMRSSGYALSGRRISIYPASKQFTYNSYE
jgi:hypothetical protein